MLSKRFLVLGFVFLLLCAPAFSKKKDQIPPISPQDEGLLRTISTCPQLMNLNYLEGIIGRPENERSQLGLLSPDYYWYDARHTLLYELQQTSTTQGAITESMFIVHLEGQNFKPQNLKQEFGEAAKQEYDSISGIPYQIYYGAPNTTLSFAIPYNTFKVQLARVAYRGPGLPSPTSIDIRAAQSALLNQASKELQQKNYSKAVMLLKEYVNRRPEDVSAHLALAQAYRGDAQVQNAIVEYKTTLNLAGSDGYIRQQCLNGLQELKALPAGTSPLIVPANSEPF